MIDMMNSKQRETSKHIPCASDDSWKQKNIAPSGGHVPSRATPLSQPHRTPCLAGGTTYINLYRVQFEDGFPGNDPGNITGWWLSPTHLKNMKVNWDD